MAAAYNNLESSSTKIVVKIKHCSPFSSDGEIRKVVLNAADEPMTLDELCFMCQRVLQLPSSVQLSLKYVDAGKREKIWLLNTEIDSFWFVLDGDLISLKDNTDLVFALIDSNNYLKLHIYGKSSGF